MPKKTAPEPEVAISIQSMKRLDLPEVLEIEKASFPLPWTENMYKDELSRPNRFYYTARAGRLLVGYAGFFHVFGEGHITTIATLPEKRRQNIAGVLLERLSEKAKELNLFELTLEVRESNEAAVKLYEKYGFEKAGLRRDYYQKPTENAIIMTLDLPFESNPNLANYLISIKKMLRGKR